MITSPLAADIDDRRLKFLTDSQKVWLDKAKDFARRVPLDDIIAADSTNTFRRDLFNAACKEGFGSLPFPTTYGGQGGDYLSFCLVNEEFGRRCLPVMSSLGVHVLCQEPVYRFGTDEQKKKYLVPSSSGEYLAAFALTEPGAGSDTAAIATRAKLVGDEYILNGTKVFITSGASADYFIVMSRLTDSEDTQGLPPEKTITAFIVEKGFAGCRIGQKFDMLGMRGYSTCELVFEDCRVPKKNLLGRHLEGRKVALSSLAKGRVTIAAQSTGWAAGALDATTQIVSGAVAAGANAASYAGALGQMVIAVESSRALTYQAACAIDKGDTNVTLAAMAKIHATDAAMSCATEGLSLAGLDGSRPHYLLERIFRDAKAGQIYEGTNQIQRMLIARDLLK